MPSITERFLKAVKRSGLKPADLAKMTGLSRGQISDIVNEKRSPTLETVDKIAERIGWPDQAGELSICDLNTKTSVIMESYWQCPVPPMELLTEDPDLFAFRWRAFQKGTKQYVPEATLRWRKILEVPRGKAQAAVERLRAERLS
jgi:transcriptional regulator with XRE-family HTH domain